MQHLDEGTIHAWLDGALDDAEAARVEQHAAECATCAAAVADARGLVAGASRILGALDHVPGGVLPRAGGASSGSARSSRSAWRVLHFTPARAAAAAILIVAAGSVLMVRDAGRGTRAAGGGTRDALTAIDATPRAAAPTKSAPTIASPAPTITAPVRAEVAKKPNVDARAEQRSALAAASPTSSAATEPVTQPAMAANADAAPARARAPAVASGFVAGSAGAAKLATAPVIVRSDWSGCYGIVADTVAALPARVALDSARLGGTAGDSTSAFAARVLGGASAQSSWWRPIPGGVRVFMSGQTEPIDLRAVAPVTLVGTKIVGDRQIQITLQRLNDCPPR